MEVGGIEPRKSIARIDRHVGGQMPCVQHAGSWPIIGRVLALPLTLCGLMRTCTGGHSLGV